MSRACIDDKSEGNITRAPPLLSRLFSLGGEVLLITSRRVIMSRFLIAIFVGATVAGSGLNVGVGMALPSQ